ncbi:MULTISPECIES: TerD family protein [Streptomyces]|uniref:TerD family protein n=1 Tax=Streptomyces siderophoricus TaxID=2802281 RepID=A0ABS1MMU3_9ACTN|nr:TerD family protein [Streptomyces sp. 9-7]MBL1089080.1 TerD family protein [Streptomyces sp. 9-7]
MTAELVRGQNHPLDRSRVEIRIAAGVPVVAGVTLGDEQGGLPDADAVVHPGAPRRPGVEVPGRAAAVHRITVDLDALPATVHRVGVLLALAAGSGAPATFGAAPAPSVRLTAVDGTGLAGYTLTGLTAETAVVAVELYRRQGAWKVRAVGQGYADGLAALLHDQGLARAAELAAEIEAAAAPAPTREAPTREAPTREVPAPVATSAAATPPATGPVDYRHPGRRSTPAPGPTVPATAAAADGPPPPVAGDAAGWSMEERLYNQIWGMFEDLARSVAAYRSASDFAASRLAQELDEVLADPRNRLGTAADVARATARDRHATLLTRARAALDRDLAQLTAESEVVEPALPPAFARWDNPVWQGHHVPLERPMALRLGDLHLPEVLDLRIPMLVRLPLERGLWIDSGPDSLARGAEPGPEREFGRRELGSALTDGPPDAAEVRRLALEAAVAIAARLLAVHPAGEFAVQVIDPGGAAGQALAPLVETGALLGPPVPGAQGVATVLEGLVRRVDLVQMAVRSRAADALPPDLDTAEQLLIVHDFPHGFDDRAVTMLRYLADEGPAAGVHLMMVADRAQAREFGPVLDPLWRSLLRITPVPDAHLADPWVGHAWTYEPALAPKGSQVVRQVLTRLAEARRAAARTEPAGPPLPPTT